MQKCPKEIIKKIEQLEKQKQDVLAEERSICCFTYQSDSDKIEYEYSFRDTRNRVRAINDKVRSLRRLLHYINSTVIVDEFNMTIGECLIYMAQLNDERKLLEGMSRGEQTTRHSLTTGTVEYTEKKYENEECRSYLANVQNTIVRLQIAIDTVNLTYKVKVA